MNVWIASDIHGSALYCRQLLDLMERQGGDRLVLLGDLLYHVEGVENYRLLSPAADLAADDARLPVLGTVTITEMEDDGDV